MFKNFVQDERSAEIDYSTCVWSKPFSSGAMDCETFLDGSVLVGMECTKTNCNTKRLQCCGVKGRFKKCKAIYNGFVALVDQSLNENWKGIIGSKAFGFNGISFTGRPLDLHHYFSLWRVLIVLQELSYRHTSYAEVVLWFRIHYRERSRWDERTTTIM